MAEIKDIDLFTKSIIRKQFAIISACVTLPSDGSVSIDSGGNILYSDISDCVVKQLGIKTVQELEEYNFEQSAILLTAIQNRFNYLIYRAVSDKWGLSPICFTVISVDELRDDGLSYEQFFPEVDALAEFIYQAKNDGYKFLINCEYGQSRSAGSGAAILQHFEQSGIKVFANYKYYPNKLYLPQTH